MVNRDQVNEVKRRPAWQTILAVLAGCAAGAAAMGVWIQYIRFEHLSTEEWTPPRVPARYAGSVSCRECHERFYKLWSPSRHGTAMQPVTAEFVRSHIPPLDAPIRIRTSLFSVDLANRRMIHEEGDDRRTYPMVHAMGGKNVYYFLTPLERGRLQVMPLAYDVRRGEWYDTTASMVRHLGEEDDAAIDWQDPMLTFNTACYNCHVSQLDKNYDASSDTYHTAWREPGINCEACHGTGEEHNRICRAVPKGTSPQSLRLISWKTFSIDQINDACAPCHVKMRPLTPSFSPGERFFDHYDMTCLEDSDFYADGRDLGENFTHTLWMMSPCVQSGLLSCIHCHTSSGRYRFREGNPNASCLPCHARRVRNPAGHTHHPDKPGAPHCISCHMPMTEFARMRRSDHSLRPPCPEAGIRFGSPVACILCHTNETPKWASDEVRRWHPDSKWQPRILREGQLVNAARKAQWDRLPAMLDYMVEEDADPVVVTSLIRLLGDCADARKWETIRRCAGHAWPLVRGASVQGLRDDVDSPRSLDIVLGALRDEYRLVRVHAASALARVPREHLSVEDQQRVQDAEAELLQSFESQPDIWSSHYNLGIYRSDQGDPRGALAAYDRAIALRGDVMHPYVNASVTASRMGRTRDAIEYLQVALRHEPNHPAVNLNLGLALAEQGDLARAETHLRTALEQPAARAQAAYNLAVLVAERSVDEAIRLCRVAAEAAPEDPRNAWTQAYYLDAAGRTAEAITVLQELLARHKEHADAWILLGSSLVKAKRPADARTHFRKMADEPSLPPNVRAMARQRLAQLEDTPAAGPP